PNVRRLAVADLAGCENVKASGAEGSQVAEAGAINKGLFTFLLHVDPSNEAQTKDVLDKSIEMCRIIPTDVGPAAKPRLAAAELLASQQAKELAALRRALARETARSATLATERDEAARLASDAAARHDALRGELLAATDLWERAVRGRVLAEQQWHQDRRRLVDEFSRRLTDAGNRSLGAANDLVRRKIDILADSGGLARSLELETEISRLEEDVDALSAELEAREATISTLESRLAGLETVVPETSNAAVQTQPLPAPPPPPKPAMTSNHGVQAGGGPPLPVAHTATQSDISPPPASTHAEVQTDPPSPSPPSVPVAAQTDPPPASMPTAVQTDPPPSPPTRAESACQTLAPTQTDPVAPPRAHATSQTDPVPAVRPSALQEPRAKPDALQTPPPPPPPQRSQRPQQLSSPLSRPASPPSPVPDLAAVAALDPPSAAVPALLLPLPPPLPLNAAVKRPLPESPAPAPPPPPTRLAPRFGRRLLTLLEEAACAESAAAAAAASAAAAAAAEVPDSSAVTAATTAAAADRGAGVDADGFKDDFDAAVDAAAFAIEPAKKKRKLRAQKSERPPEDTPSKDTTGAGSLAGRALPRALAQPAPASSRRAVRARR
ncbi:hypothetical protein HK405_011497, partial [Cladochytrium tenue]